jgi:hypothetical protein
MNIQVITVGIKNEILQIDVLGYLLRKKVIGILKIEYIIYGEKDIRKQILKLHVKIDIMYLQIMNGKY